MGRMLSRDEGATVDRSDDPTLLYVDDERTDEVLAAVGSDTARAVVRALTEAPRTPSELADDLDVSVQNVGYHLDNLADAGLVEVHDTVYSEKGREMDVYGPSSDPTLVFFGTAEDDPQLRSAFEDFSAALGPVAVLLAVKETAPDLPELLDWL